MASAMIAVETQTGCRKVRRPIRPWGSGAPERSSSAGVPMAPPASTTWRASTRSRRPLGRMPPRSRAAQSTAVTPSPVISRRSARHRVSSVAPRSNAAGMVVTSIDCLASTGQPRPQ